MMQISGITHFSKHQHQKTSLLSRMSYHHRSAATLRINSPNHPNNRRRRPVSRVPTLAEISNPTCQILRVRHYTLPSHSPSGDAGPATASRLPPTVRRLRRPTPPTAARASIGGRRTLTTALETPLRKEWCLYSQETTVFHFAKEWWHFMKLEVSCWFQYQCEVFFMHLLKRIVFPSVTNIRLPSISLRISAPVSLYH